MSRTLTDIRTQRLLPTHISVCLGPHRTPLDMHTNALHTAERDSLCHKADVVVPRAHRAIRTTPFRVSHNEHNVFFSFTLLLFLLYFLSPSSLSNLCLSLLILSPTSLFSFVLSFFYVPCCDVIDFFILLFFTFLFSFSFHFL